MPATVKKPRKPVQRKVWMATVMDDISHQIVLFEGPEAAQMCKNWCLNRLNTMTDFKFESLAQFDEMDNSGEYNFYKAGYNITETPVFSLASSRKAKEYTKAYEAWLKTQQK